MRKLASLHLGPESPEVGQAKDTRYGSKAHGQSQKAQSIKILEQKYSVPNAFETYRLACIEHRPLLPRWLSCVTEPRT